MRLFQHDLFRRSALFASSIIASTLVGVFSIPILMAQVGATSWGHLAVLQIAGQFFAVAAAFGWGATGPSMVSAADREDRKSIYVESLVVRGVLTAILVPLAAVAGLALTGQSPDVVWLAAITYVAPGLSAGWYLIGTNRPTGLFLFDALPAILGQVTGLVVVSFSPTLASYLWSTATWAVLGIAASCAFVLTRKTDGPARSRTRVSWGHLLRTQLGGASTMLAASVWSAAPTVLVQALSPQSVPMFAMIDRLVKYGVLALAPVLQAIQSWVPEAGAEEVPHRSRRAVAVALAIGGLGGGILAIFAPLASDLLSLGQVSIPVYLAILAGAVFVCESVAQIAGLSSLVALGGTRHLAFSSVVGTCGGVLIACALVWWLGVLGAVLTMLVVAAWLMSYRVVWVGRLSARATAGGLA